MFDLETLSTIASALDSRIDYIEEHITRCRETISKTDDVEAHKRFCKHVERWNARLHDVTAARDKVSQAIRNPVREGLRESCEEHAVS